MSRDTERVEFIVARALCVQARLRQMKLEQEAAYAELAMLERQAEKLFEDKDGEQLYATDQGVVRMRQHTGYAVIPRMLPEARRALAGDAWRELFFEQPTIYGPAVFPTPAAIARLSSADDEIGDYLRDVISMKKIRAFEFLPVQRGGGHADQNS